MTKYTLFDFHEEGTVEISKLSLVEGEIYPSQIKNTLKTITH